MESWRILREDQKIRLLYNLLKALLGFLSIVVASEHVSRAVTAMQGGPPAMHYGEALSIFALGAVALREGARWIMASPQAEAHQPPR